MERGSASPDSPEMRTRMRPLRLGYSLFCLHCHGPRKVQHSNKRDRGMNQQEAVQRKTFDALLSPSSSREHFNSRLVPASPKNMIQTTTGTLFSRQLNTRENVIFRGL